MEPKAGWKFPPPVWVEGGFGRRKTLCVKFVHTRSSRRVPEHKTGTHFAAWVGGKKTGVAGNNGLRTSGHTRNASAFFIAQRKIAATFADKPNVILHHSEFPRLLPMNAPRCFTHHRQSFTTLLALMALLQLARVANADTNLIPAGST